jgi:threonine dehydratase
VLAVLAERAPEVQLIAVQSDASPAFVTSLRTGRVHTRWPATETLAEGLEGGTGELGVSLARRYGVRAETVSEASIAKAMVRLLDGLGETVEGSASVVEAFLAADASSTPSEPAAPCVGILTGGNVARATVEQLRHA